MTFVIFVVCDHIDTKACRSRRAIDTARNATATAPARGIAERVAQAQKPVLKRLHQVLRSCALDDLRLRQPVSEPLALRVRPDRPC